MMVSSKSLFSVAVASLAFAGVASAQTQFNNLHKVSSINHATYDLKTGEVNKQKAGGIACWSNTDTSYFFSFPGSTGGVDEWTAIGDNSASNEAAGCAGGTGIISCFSFGYASNVLSTSVGGPGVTYGTTFYSGSVLGSTAGTAQSGLLFSGLPGATAPGTSVPGWLITVPLTGGFEFCLPDGAFGFGTVFFSAGTGPLLCYAGNGAGGADGNGMIDAFDWYSPPAISGGTLLGSFFFGGAPFDFSSWYVTLQEEDGSCGTATTSVEPLDGGGLNPLGYTGSTAVINANYTGTCTTPTGVGSFCFLLYNLGANVPADFTLTLGGLLQEIEILPAPVTGSITTFVAGSASFTLAVPKNLSLCGTISQSQCVGFGTGDRKSVV